MKKNIFELFFVTIQKGMWQLLEDHPWILRGCLFGMVVMFFLTILTIRFGSKKTLRKVLTMVNSIAIVAICIVLGVFYGIEIPTPTPTAPSPTSTPTPTPHFSEIESFFERGTYSKEYEALSIYTNTIPSFFGMKEGTVFVAEKTNVKAELRLSQMSISLSEGNLEIYTLRTGYDVFSVSIPMGESLYSFGAFEVPKDELSWETLQKKLDEGVSKSTWRSKMDLATSRAYKLSILEGKRRIKKTLLQEMLEEKPFLEIENISIDGVSFKKNGKILEVKQSDINNLFDFGLDPKIEEPAEEEKLELYFAGEQLFEEKSSIFEGIKKYREDKGLDRVTGLSS